MGIYGRFYFRPAPGEQIHTELRPAESSAAAIVGLVRSDGGKPLPGAVALLFSVRDGEEPELLAAGQTDDEGQFCFGPLEAGQLYLVKVFKSGSRQRELELPAE